MRRLLNTILAAAAVLGAAMSLSISAASAQQLLNNCNATVESLVGTSASAQVITSSTFVDLFRSQVTFPTAIPADCAVLTFNATSACKGTSGGDQCYIRLLDNGVEMLPRTGARRVFDSNSSQAAHTVIGVRRGLFTGTHTFTVQGRVGANGTKFLIDDWLVKIDVLS